MLLQSEKLDRLLHRKHLVALEAGFCLFAMAIAQLAQSGSLCQPAPPISSTR
jgi:hypothetical protein